MVGVSEPRDRDPTLGTANRSDTGAEDSVVGPAVVSPAVDARAVERLARAVSTPPAVAVVEGAAGAGKTRLVNELVAHPSVRGRVLVTGNCHRMRERFPLGAVIDALRGLDEELAPGGLSPVAGALRPLLPEVAHLLPPAPDPLDDPVAERHRVFRALVEVLRALRSAVMIIENLQWADSQTVDFVEYLTTDLPPLLALVVTFRDEEVEPDVRALVSALPGSVTHAHIHLTPVEVRAPAVPEEVRAAEGTADAAGLAVIQVDTLVLDSRTRDVHRAGRPIDLTPTEFRLLEFLMRNARQVLTHEVIFERVWGLDYWPQSNTLRVYVGYLRHKTEAAGERRLIHTVRGVGYMLRD
jgi:hypothetical protein